MGFLFGKFGLRGLIYFKWFVHFRGKKLAYRNRCSLTVGREEEGREKREERGGGRKEGEGGRKERGGGREEGGGRRKEGEEGERRERETRRG